MTAAIDVVDEIKAKLVAAREPGVDQAQRSRPKSPRCRGSSPRIASAASFSGENWLSVDSTGCGLQLLEGCRRLLHALRTGSVSVGTVTIETASMELFDAKTNPATTTTGTGILDTRLRPHRRYRRHADGGPDGATDTFSVANLGI